MTFQQAVRPRPRVALITGGTSGIGLAFADLLAAEGCDLVLVARHADALARTAARFPGVHVETIPADLTDPKGVDAVLARLDSPDRPVDVLVNNAGQGLYASLASRDTAALERGISLMATVPVKLGAHAAAAMKQRGGGMIINISSINSFVPFGLYSAIKALVRVWSESLAVELTGTGVSCTAVLPGWVHSNFHKNAGGKRSNIPDALWLEPDVVAREGLAAAKEGRLRCTPSIRYKVIGWFAEHAPRGIVAAVSRRINGASPVQNGERNGEGAVR
ncbi:SDR family NAD(P)-dependent oxidoreductase [Neoactinobaculum massilliense]|uniref:SDR family NAD(P)-dependent oxidoreductase n=1 Tax=Neoactinobaculum massilliense TaxID=2364794 RepID=UPI001F14CEA9|nr:SDR family NAD(P)-dependent oxidoreductase [Neoactinobaculum massilliense]